MFINTKAAIDNPPLAQGVVLGYNYSFNPLTGNLSWRKDNIENIQENFTYDNLNRLEKVAVGSQELQMRYDNSGNIHYKYDIGRYSYNGYKVDKIDSHTSIIPTIEQNITYNGFGKVNSIEEGDASVHFTYAPDRQRVKAVEKKGSVTVTRYYLASQEREVSGSITKDICYVHSPYGLVAVVEKNGATFTTMFVSTDHLGSIVGLLSYSGSLIQKLSYDAWGNLRNPKNYSQPFSGIPRLRRGFTGHEHLPEFGLINMNGRFYDPRLGRFLSPDSYVQAPDFTQNFNRYAYCLNNPLVYTDPSGEFIFTALLPGVGVFLDAMCWGAVIGGGIGGIRGAMTEGMTFWDGAWRGAVVGAVGGLMAPIGGAGMTFGANLGLGTAEGAITGGLDAALWGNDIGKGILWGVAAGAVFTTLTSENFSNWTKGKGFYNNENVFNNFKVGKYGIPEGSTWQQEALNYFGFEGLYKPDLSGPSYHPEGSYWGKTLENGDIAFGDLAFGNYATLKGTYIKESFHAQKVLNGIPYDKVPKEFQGLGFDIFPEEIQGYIHAYKNQGLFLGHNLPFQGIKYYQIHLNLFGIPFSTYTKSWIYKIPRRW